MILLGAGCGYVASAIARHSPTSRVIRLFYADDVARAAGNPADSWWPGCREELSGFLRARVEDLQVTGIRCVEWRPSAGQFPDVAGAVRRQVSELLAALSASVTTIAAFGGRWLANAFRNLRFLTQLGAVRVSGARPIVVAASGPSLERALPALTRSRYKYELWALPSAVTPLLACGLDPDLVVLTDAGFWGSYHLHHLGPRSAVAMPLSAATGTWAVDAQVRLFVQPVWFEEDLIVRLGIRCPRIAPQGTVAATALALATTSGAHAVFVAGLDLSSLDLITHARPNTFDALSHAGSSRLRNAHTGAYTRAGASSDRGARQTDPMTAYATWFSRRAWPGVRRLEPSGADLPGMASLSGDDFARELHEADLSARARQEPSTSMSAAGQPDDAFRRALLAQAAADWRREMDRESGTILPDLPGVRRDLPAFADTPAYLAARRAATVGDHDEAVRLSDAARASACRLIATLVERWAA